VVVCAYAGSAMHASANARILDPDMMSPKWCQETLCAVRESDNPQPRQPRLIRPAARMAPRQESNAQPMGGPSTDGPPL
jgi:hypothetical protein